MTSYHKNSNAKNNHDNNNDNNDCRVLVTDGNTGSFWYFMAMACHGQIRRGPQEPVVCTDLPETQRRRPEPPGPRFRCLAGLKGVGQPRRLQKDSEAFEKVFSLGQS